MNHHATHDSLPTRPSLLLRLKDWGDQASWTTFCEHYSHLIYKFALKSEMTHAEAEEVVQETLISVVKNIGDFRYDPAVCSFKTWLLRATWWKIQGQLRRRRRAQSIMDPIAGPSSHPCDRLECIADPAVSDLEQRWQGEWENNLLEVALERVKRRVSARHYQVFDLYALQGWPVLDVARTLGVSAASVYLVRHRVGGLLKKELRLVEERLNKGSGST